jgi:DNA polymerase/3'-5' exonuclease PolX
MGLPDRQPRPIIPGEKLAFNKRIVERLANACYTAEIENAPPARQWQLRKAAWAVEDLETDLRLILRTLGRKGLESIPGIGPSMALEIEQLAQSDPTPD